MKIYLITIVLLLFMLAGCQGIVPQKNNENQTTENSGGYYLDDGPDINVPKNLDAIKNATPKSEPIIKYASRPYKAFGKKYIPMKKIRPYKMQGYASWYGKRYHGNKTSIGEIYDMYKMTAAHKTLPLPCYVKVTNMKNNRSVIVRVNDRGPFVKGRVIDLSYVAAHQLRIIEKGSELVKVEVIDPKNLELTETPKFYIQAGAFSNKENAEKMTAKLNEVKLNNKIEAKKITKGALYQVLIGPYFSRESAEFGLSEFTGKIKINSFITQM